MTAEVLGRDAELVALGAFLDRLHGSAGALVLAGAAGAGKTTLLCAGAALASGRGFMVVQTTPVRSELPLAFARLADLLEQHLDSVIGELPARGHARCGWRCCRGRLRRSRRSRG